jgi:hypothetical protein
MDELEKKKIKALNALNFLRNHPALSCTDADSMFDGNWFMMAKCCKRGLSEHAKRSVTIYKGEKGWSKYKDRFEKEYADKDGDDDFPKEFQYVDVTYKEKYGEPWKFDHVEYWYETSFFLFDGENPYEPLSHYDRKNWGAYSGPMGGARTFEDAIIKQANQVRRTFGSFSLYNDKLLTQAEINNHKQVRAFNSSKIKSGKGKGFYALNRNSEHIDVTDAVLNLRWLEWFIETDYCKKRWGCSIKEFKAKVKKLKTCKSKEYKKLERKYSKNS